MLEILDIEGVLILDNKFNRVYGREYGPLKLNKDLIRESIKNEETGTIFFTNDHLVIYRKINDVLIIFYGSLYCNELYLNSMLNILIESISLVLKKEISVSVLDNKFDYLVLLIEYFIYDGMFMVETVEELVKMIPKRNFEDIKGMPVPKGFSSIFKKVKFFK